MATSPIDPAHDPGRGVASRLPVFDGFPYLVTRIAPAMYHITILPRGVDDRGVAVLGRAQWRANRLECCLVLGEQRVVYIAADGVESLASDPPRGGIVMCGNLKVPAGWPHTPEMRGRQRRLAAFIDQHCPKGGYGFGDLSKGGRDATADDIALLAGAGPDGAPRGLERCSVCHDWRGTCLDPSPTFLGKVMRVHCRCENDNRCAACGGFLYERKLNANYYDPRDRQIWHVPGFSGLSHQCPATFASADDGVPPERSTQ